MMDSFDEKRGMVKKLLDMLKAHAANEVSNGLSKPEGEGDMHGVQVEKVEVIPDHEMDTPTPEHDVVTHEMHKGGVVEKVNATDPTPKIHSGPIPYESEDGQPDKEGAAHKEVGEPLPTREAATTEEHEEPLDTEYPEAESEAPSLFASFLGKKKKK